MGAELQGEFWRHWHGRCAAQALCWKGLAPALKLGKLQALAVA